MDPAREGEDPHPLGPRSTNTIIRIFIGFMGFLLPCEGLTPILRSPYPGKGLIQNTSHLNFFSPARMGTLSQFSSGAKGQVYFSLNWQKGLCARLKSIRTLPSGIGSMYR